MVTRLIKIRVPLGWHNSEEWEVPYGFGKEYLRRARNKVSANVWCDMLGLIGYTVTRALFDKLTLQQRIEGELYASREYLSASDNAIVRHPKPTWLPEKTHETDICHSLLRTTG